MGITSGASTPDNLVEQTILALDRFATGPRNPSDPPARKQHDGPGRKPGKTAMRMPAKPFICLVLSLILLGWPGVVAAQGFKWWQSDQFKQELGLTSEQVSRLEEIFQALQPTLRTQKETLDKVREQALESGQRSEGRRGAGAADGREDRGAHAPS